MRQGPAVSVIVASYNSASTLEKCLESLEAQMQAGDQVIVADCSDQDPRLSFRRQFPHVRFVRFDQRMTIPELRREAFKFAANEILLLTEGRIVPSKDWAVELCGAHFTHPKAPAVGGPIDFESSARRFDAAVFFCEYGLHVAPIPDGEATELSGANVSYKRWALDLCPDLVEAAAWEPFLHRRLEQHGYRLLRAGRAVVCYHNTLDPGQFLRQRFHYGRWFAAMRVQGPRRLLYAGFCPLLPFLLTARLGRLALARGRGKDFFRALPWIVFFQAFWSLGEFSGYLLGTGRSDRQVF